MDRSRLLARTWQPYVQRFVQYRPTGCLFRWPFGPCVQACPETFHHSPSFCPANNQGAIFTSFYPYLPPLVIVLLVFASPCPGFFLKRLLKTEVLQADPRSFFLDLSFFLSCLSSSRVLPSSSPVEKDQDISLGGGQNSIVSLPGVWLRQRKHLCRLRLSLTNKSSLDSVKPDAGGHFNLDLQSVFAWPKRPNCVLKLSNVQL